MEEFKQDIKELKEMFVEHSLKQDKIYSVLVGQPEFKIKGLVEEVDILKKDKENRIKRNAAIFGASVAGALGLQKLFTYIGSFF